MKRRLFTTSDDNVIVKQVLDTHLPDGRDVDHVESIVHYVEEILRNGTADVAAHTDEVSMLSYVIDKLAREMSNKCLSGVDGHTTALSLFHTVQGYFWSAKLVLILAAFAEIYSSSQWAKSMTMEHSASLMKPRIDALNQLIHSVIELTRCIIQLTELPARHLSDGVPAMDAALNSIPIAVYWNVRGIIACAAQITSLTSMGELEYWISSSTSEIWELCSLTHKINNLLEFLKEQLEECRRVIGIGSCNAFY